jgi:leucyl aminopeptidase
MATMETHSALSFNAVAPAAVEADLLVVPWFEAERADAIPGLDVASGGEVGRAIGAGEVTGKPYEVFLTPVTDRSWRAPRIALMGAGPPSEYGPFLVRRLATAAGLAARQRRIARTAFLVRADRAAQGQAGDLVQAAAEGLTLAEFDSGSYKTTEVLPPAPGWQVVASSGAEERRAARGRLLGECSNLARRLANEPGNRLTPTEFARRAVSVADGQNLSVEVLDPDRIEQLGMGLLLGVARGSSEPPRLIVMRYEPSGAPQTPVLALIGKGVTFDTGGISIKPAENMDRMKDDMAGGAAVIGAMRGIATLAPPVRVIGIVPTTENMPGGRAIKPGDILTGASGTTVEVLNTDAEGRLILGDALWYARRLGATHLVDVATLTGACVVALGKITSGLFGSSQAWVDLIHQIADAAGDRVWPMPLFAEYRDQLKSEIADITNTGGRPAGAVTAAMFLKEFSGGLPWAHLDIAGTAWSEDARPHQPKGATGVAVRTLVELACAVDRWARISS